MDTVEMRIKGGEPVPVQELQATLKGNTHGGQTVAERLALKGLDVMLVWSREKGRICYVRKDLHPSQGPKEDPTPIATLLRAVKEAKEYLDGEGVVIEAVDRATVALR